ncbi:LPS export ABC transporter periplasmic protein LptC [Marnyiella aurantia]|uniref:LPS export ABC transporter periplasmic protein LptC n=1 Tax=Marnyiella aurantia TaxID=2758037 RepID=A0A7D7LTS9_9FLAO|nr:LPS export ABC transporter periplasmic protein LptC [Marnyiella aurantia]MBA5246143.1 LPS export ABC transporter periplasmic protein LptC [Marnyiella aurantia]QMS98473.1 LPS export ABC transporter periplasmic protein LptC [Marnyiella aurantia]
MGFLCGIKFKNIACLLGLAIFFISCEEDLATVNSKSTKINFPSQVIYDAKIVQRDSGMVKMRATAPLIEKFELIDTPYVVARKGIDIEYFDRKNPKNPGRITAKFAKMTEMKRFYEARGNVKVITSEGQMFAMQTVFWDQAKKEIYTSDTVYVTDKDGSTLVAANGMRAKDDFSEYTFFNNAGDINAKKIPEQKR